MAEFVMPGLPKYGAIELKEVHRKYMTIALIDRIGFLDGHAGHLLRLEAPERGKTA